MQRLRRERVDSVEEDLEEQAKRKRELLGEGSMEMEEKEVKSLKGA